MSGNKKLMFTLFIQVHVLLRVTSSSKQVVVVVRAMGQILSIIVFID